MAEIYFLLACAICLGQIAWALRRPNGVIEYPFLNGCVFLGWFLPQAYRVMQIRWLPAGAAENLLAVTCICAACGFLGYLKIPKAQKLPSLQLDLHRLAQIACVMALAGSYFFWQLYSLPEHELARGQWAGAPVKFLFLSQFLTFGFFIAIAVYLKTRDRLALVPIAIGTALFVGRILITGRRGATIELALLLLILLWFLRGWRPSKALCIAAIPLVIIAVNGIGIYRSTVFEGGKYGVLQHALDRPLERMANGVSAVVNRADELLAPKACHEVLNAALIIHSCRLTERMDFGASHWNALVFRYVPGQVVGHDFKNSLMFRLPPEFDPRLGYVKPVGTTTTGVAEGYASFGYFGGLKFLAIGMLMRWLWERASHGALEFQLAYACVAASSMLAVTHSTHYLIGGVVDFVGFVVPAFYIASTVGKAEGNRCVSRSYSITSGPTTLPD